MNEMRRFGRRIYADYNLSIAQQRRAGGFTLLEMLVVLVIIGLIASLVGPQLMGRVDTSKVTAADTQVRMLKSALDTMRLDIGRYPTKDEGLALLVVPPKDDRTAPKWQGPYLSESTVPMDPWGNPYQYDTLPGTTNVYIYSFGADGQPGGEGINADIGFVPKTADFGEVAAVGDAGTSVRLTVHPPRRGRTSRSGAH